MLRPVVEAIDVHHHSLRDFQFLRLPSAIHSIAVSSRFSRVASCLAATSHSDGQASDFAPLVDGSFLKAPRTFNAARANCSAISA